MSRYLNKGKNGWYRVYALLLIIAGVFLTKKEDFMINIKENEKTIFSTTTPMAIP